MDVASRDELRQQKTNNTTPYKSVVLAPLPKPSASRGSDSCRPIMLDGEMAGRTRGHRYKGSMIDL